MISSSAYKAGGRRRKCRVTFRVMAFVFPSNRYASWSPDFLGIAEQVPVDGK